MIVSRILDDARECAKNVADGRVNEAIELAAASAAYILQMQLQPSDEIIEVVPACGKAGKGRRRR